MNDTNVIVVGIGDYWRNILSPTLQTMEQKGNTHLLATVDIKPWDEAIPLPVEHKIRPVQQPLSELLSKYKGQEPVVILGHSNEFHTPDARDLVENGFRVLVEKPYCVNERQCNELERLLSDHPRSIALAEYYVMMKAIPLLILAGSVRPQSYYFQESGILKAHEGLAAFAQDCVGLSGKLKELIGNPRFIYSDVLEGEGATGRLDHRGPSLVDRRKGGGMLQDLGLHTLAPLFALENYIGSIDETLSQGSVRTATCSEYQQWAREQLGIDKEYIGETYAEIHFSTSSGVPVIAALGKYVLPQRNQRRIVIIGDEGQLLQDQSSCTLYLSPNDKCPIKTIEVPKLAGSKYYPVIRSGLEVLAGDNPFSFDSTSISFRSQKMVLTAMEKATAQRDGETIYTQESSPQDIFPLGSWR